MCTLINGPEDAVYVDLLVKMGPENEAYVPFNRSSLKDHGLSETSPIVQYDADGFCSYTFHYKDAQSEFRLDEYSHTYYAESNMTALIEEFRFFRLAVLDREGNILQIPDTLDLDPDELGSFLGYLYYDAATNSVDFTIYAAPLDHILR